MPDAGEAEAAIAGRTHRARSRADSLPLRRSEPAPDHQPGHRRSTRSTPDTAEELIAHADAAMYQAKEAGKNAWRSYRADLDTSREMVTAHDLERAHQQGAGTRPAASCTSRAFITPRAALWHTWKCWCACVTRMTRNSSSCPVISFRMAEKNGKILLIRPLGAEAEHCAASGQAGDSGAGGEYFRALVG